MWQMFYECQMIASIFTQNFVWLTITIFVVCDRSMNASAPETPSRIISSLINFSSNSQLTNKCHMSGMSAFSAQQNLGAVFFSLRLHNRNTPMRVISECVVIQAMWACQPWSVTSWNRPFCLVISRCGARSFWIQLSLNPGPAFALFTVSVLSS